ncbi:MAG TPA: hypothetical protein VJM50_13490, partial [Pyrinomonadaceae bacterium]|nr:hypothetical protein [Pyrinomonadaceae bacterium]
ILVQRRSVLLIAAAVVIVIGLSTVIAVTGAFKVDHVAETPPPQNQTQSAPVAAPAEIAKSAVAAAAFKPNRSATERREEKRNKQDEKRNSEPVAESVTPPATTKETGTSSPQAIKVVMQIENGRVLKASIANHKPGMDSYEALALRIARQRRYPATTSGGETVTISVSRPEQ